MNKKVVALFLFCFGTVACIYSLFSLAGFSPVQTVHSSIPRLYRGTVPVDIPEYTPETFCLKDYAQETVKSGAVLYQKNCIYCHATNDDGDLSLLSLSEIVEQLGRDQVLDIVKNGRRQMPVYGSILSDHEIETLFAYLEELKDEK